MGDVNDLDYNDAMDQMNGQNPEAPVIASVSNDSNFPSSISGLGIDENDPEENERYIHENLHLQPADYHNRHSEHDSGLTQSLSRTRSSESRPESSGSQSNQGDLENQIANFNIDDGNIDEAKQNEHEDFMSAYDLALERGYVEQAQMYHAVQLAQGLKINTKHFAKLREVCTPELFEASYHELESEELDKEDADHVYIHEQIKMKVADFKQFLLDLMNNFEKVSRRIEEKMKDDPEHPIKYILVSKENRYKVKQEMFDQINAGIKEIEKYESDFLEFEEAEQRTLIKRISVCKYKLKRVDLAFEKTKLVKQWFDTMLNELEALFTSDSPTESTTQRHPEKCSDSMNTNDTNAELEQPGPSNDSMYAEDHNAAQSYLLARRLQKQNSSDSEIEDENKDNRC